MSVPPKGDFPPDEKLMAKPGFVDRKHFTAYVEDVRQLKRESQFEDAEALLLRLVGATEAESKSDGCGVAPWYYEQLAIIYKRMKRPADELAILERYESRTKAPGATPGKLAKRLAGLRAKGTK